MVYNLSSNFIQRLLMGLLLGSVFGAIIYVSNDPIFQPLFVLVVALVIAGALWEYYRIAKTNGHAPVEAVGIMGSIAYLYALGSFPWPFLVLALILFCAFLYYFFTGLSPLVNLAITLFGVVYLTLPLSTILLINSSHGRYWTLYLLLVTKATDIGGYFIGKKWGRYRLAPVISPKKTWEGAIAGVVLGMLVSAGLYLGAPLFSSIWYALGFGALMAMVAQIGDLSESLLKRDSGVKDSNKLPGFGGILDMVDSLVFTAPFLYFFLEVL